MFDGSPEKSIAVVSLEMTGPGQEVVQHALSERA